MQEFVTILRDLALLDGKPYSSMGAFLDILLVANKNNGEFCMSERKLMDRWGWSRRRVRSFIECLSERTIIEPKSNQNRTIVWLVNSMVFGKLRTKNEPKSNQEPYQKPATELAAVRTEKQEVYARIINYLNNRCGVAFKVTNTETIKFIQERLDEGFAEEDFYTVIDKKANEWIGTKWEQYLRPCTLFRKDKFENYLNQNIVKPKGKTEQMLEDHYKMMAEWRMEMEEKENDIQGI